jgi:hypothetical protein
MAEIINLGKVRKARARAEETKRAAENRAKHGRSKGQKSKEELECEKIRDALDQAKRDDNS